MRYVNRRSKEAQTPPKRRLKTKSLLYVIGLLILLNLIWFFAWMFSSKPAKNDEVVATIAGEEIMRETWMAAMETKIGRETLQELINVEVMKAVAKASDIRVSDKEIDIELELIRSIDQGIYVGLDEEKEREVLASKLILEKVLTQDVVIAEEDIQAYFNDNIEQFETEDAYRTSVIVVSSLQDAEKGLQELKEGSNFAVLAKEISIDSASSNLGGDIGFINHSTDGVDEKIIDTAAALKKGEVSDPISLEGDTYALITVQDTVKGRHFKLKEVAGHIERTLAMRQLPEKVTPEDFWKDFKVEWFYENK